LCHAYPVLGFDSDTDDDEVFRDLVAARIIEPTSKGRCAAGAVRDRSRPPAYRTLKRRQPVFPKPDFRQ
jgi:hypothetical protein